MIFIRRHFIIISEINHNKITQTLRNFIKSGDYIINFKHSNISFLEHIKKFN